MIIKNADDKTCQIQQLEGLLNFANADQKNKITQELRNLRAGIKAEQEAAYLIDFDLGKSQNTLVIHDLRLEIGGRVAQIDHLLINRTLNIFVLETKHFHAGLKITDDGEFMSWNDFKKCYEGMPSPFAQNERHIAVLTDALARIDMPSKIGLRLSPVCHSYVLVSSKARIDRPKKFDTSRIIKSDMLSATLDKFFDKAGVIEVVGSLARCLSAETLEKVGKTLFRMHRPASFDYAAKFGIQQVQQSAPSVTAAPSVVAKSESAPQVVTSSGKPADQHTCRECKSTKLSVQYGKYGYYFKCGNCESNTPIKISCGKNGHKERIRKDGLNFYRECSDCGSSTLFFVNQQ
ncbi:hypothetical protein RW64_08420 [Geobacter sulfurreducens]|nr:hypothetical protein RW64_08420 [Geobacter sulfurreducens]